MPPRDCRDAYPEVGAILHERREAFLSVLREIERHADALHALRGEPKGTPRWNQDWFPRLDGAAAYVLVRRHTPRHIVEIGSGHSTRFLVRAVRDGDIDCRLTAIDPAPRASLDALNEVRHVRATLQELFASAPGEADRAFGTVPCLDELGPGDILFVDSSHILMPGSDVDLVVNRMLPRLAAGVIVHFHDVFLPDDYPPSWTWRGYNEQAAIAPLLTTGAYEPLFASRYVSTCFAEAIGGGAVASIPLQPGALETSLWLIKRVEPVPTGK